MTPLPIYDWCMPLRDRELVNPPPTMASLQELSGPAVIAMLMASAIAALDGLAGVRVPTLVVTGEPGLDRVVPTALTAEYTRIWPHAQAVTLARTGHLGLVTRPDAFAGAVVPFAETCGLAEDLERRVG